MGACCSVCSSENEGSYAPLLAENEREAVSNLLRYLDNRGEVNLFSDGPLKALTTLVYSDNLDLQRSAALAFAEITEKYIRPVSREALEPILLLLQSSDVEIQRAAGAALGNLAVNNENKRLVVEMGGLEPLIRQMMSPNVEVQCNAVGCMTNLATHEDNKAKIARSGALMPLTKLAKSKDIRVQRNATGALLNMTHSDENRQELVNAGAIPVLVSLLSSKDADVQYYCTTALSNIAVDLENRRKLSQTEPRLVNHLVSLMGSSSPRVQCQAALALRNLASDVNYQLEITRADGLPHLLNLLQSSHTPLILAAVACIRNISIHPLNESSIVEAGFLKPLVELLGKTDNEEIQCHTISTLRNLAASSERTKLEIVEAGAVQKCLQLLPNAAPSVQSEITAALAVLALGDELKGGMLSMGIIEVLLPLTAIDNIEVQGNSAAALGNLSSKVGNYDPFIKCWTEPAGGVKAFLESFLTSQEPTFEHIAVWMILQLLEAEDKRLTRLFVESPEILKLVESLAQREVVDSAGNPLNANNRGNNPEDQTYASQMAVPALAKRVISLLK
ncbi:protein anchor VAC8 [Sugiyamaella lignohabitans]|uniref:Vacuolar protein 8 n=1 Tax=Sugiyamaella lignohabitans TaxID=796027 RepID=A0A161HH80_9ASCO|nr:protein anchor VAC8 [Sugiyamaella lignohabitans]ANB15280.1 protein anchor VAC8 [Sugiyamaella lignohabitans]